jgi:glycosyltransferase involved in cell wall biosynthesis
MRILLLINGMHPRDGGPPRVVVHTALALKRCGESVTIATCQNPVDHEDIRLAWSMLHVAGVDLVFLDASKTWDIISSRRFRRSLEPLLQAHDVVHIHSFWSLLTWYAAETAIRLGKPYLISTHGVLDRRAMRNSHFKLFKKNLAVAVFSVTRLVEHSSGIVFGSDSEVRESWLLSRHMPVRVVPNGIDHSVALCNADDVKLTKLDGIAPGYTLFSKKLLYFARIHPEKGLDLLIQAFSNLGLDFPDATLLVAGIKQDEQFEARIKHMIDQSKVSQRIYFNTAMTGQDWMFLVDVCDIFVLPSFQEGFSVALIEAMSYAKPVLATRYCHVPEIETRCAGKIADASVESIQEKLREMLSLAPSKLQKMGQNAKALVIDEFTLESVADKLRALYSSAVIEAEKRG